jgi:hypothetical protein
MSDRVVPVLRLAVLCQSIEADGDDRPFALEGPIHTLRWPTGDRVYQPPTMELYVQLEDAVGTFYVRGVLRPVGETTELFRAPAEEVVFDGITNRIIPLELGLVLGGLAFAAGGVRVARVRQPRLPARGERP